MRYCRPKTERGAVAVELAVALVFLFLLAFGIADFGRIFYWGITLDGAARAGVGYGVQNNGKAGETAAIEQAAKNEAADIGEITVSSDRLCKCPDGGTLACSLACPNSAVPEVYVQVTVSKTFNTLANYPGIPNEIPLSRTALFRVQ
jgi:Flp pilus assembly protein TadG